MSEQTAYPLCWPEGWPRTKYPQESRFGRLTSRGRHSMYMAVGHLQHEVDLLGGNRAVLSTNVKLKINGEPYSQLAQPSDCGACLYFQLKAKPVSLACDKWNRVEDNVWAIAKHIEALRGQERWGIGTMEQAFRGYMALPGVGESSASDWWKTLGVTINASPEQVKEAYRLLVKKHHPDRGGDPELFNRVQRAMERFEDTLKHAA